ncbi:MAG: DUF763 domain-containing protein [Steroidobacteraceae bacterium]
MANRTGSADLPLHSGHVPPWLVTRMASLGRVIVEAIVHHYGRDELLRRLAHPFWFQAFGTVMGMDWHSSGITTSVIGALKRGLSPVQDELGLYVCGGRGRHSRRTPDELIQVGERTGLDAVPLVSASRLVAKVDSAAVQDGFDLYLHSFIVTADGKWCVVQQGMSDARSEARRYHWLSENLESFLDSPHSAIEGRNQGTIVNLADVRAARNRHAGLELVQGGPDLTIAVLKRLRDSGIQASPAGQRVLTGKFGAAHPNGGDRANGAGRSKRASRAHQGNTALSLFPELEPQLQAEPPLPYLHMPAHHDVRMSDVVLRRLHGVLAAAADRGPKDFTELLLTPGVGARTVASLALVAEVVHGTPSRFSDPARFAMAHGGKDGHPFPVPLKVYDETIRVLKSAVDRAKLGNADRLHAIQRLDVESRALERAASGPAFETFVRDERAKSADYDGRTV